MQFVIGYQSSVKKIIHTRTCKVYRYQGRTVRYMFEVRRVYKSLALLAGKGVPLQDPYFLKNGQINRVTNFSSTFRPTEFYKK